MSKSKPPRNSREWHYRGFTLVEDTHRGTPLWHVVNAHRRILASSAGPDAQEQRRHLERFVDSLHDHGQIETYLAMKPREVYRTAGGRSKRRENRR